MMLSVIEGSYIDIVGLATAAVLQGLSGIWLMQLVFGKKVLSKRANRDWLTTILVGVGVILINFPGMGRWNVSWEDVAVSMLLLLSSGYAHRRARVMPTE